MRLVRALVPRGAPWEHCLTNIGVSSGVAQACAQAGSPVCVRCAGRLVLRIAWHMPDTFEIVHLNDIAAPESIAYLIKYDSIHGTWPPDVEYGDGFITISDGQRSAKIACTQQSDITKVCLRVWHGKRVTASSSSCARTPQHQHCKCQGRQHPGSHCLPCKCIMPASVCYSTCSSTTAFALTSRMTASFWPMHVQFSSCTAAQLLTAASCAGRLQSMWCAASHGGHRR